jgi:thiamine-phosphate pyrophosphorylase
MTDSQRLPNPLAAVASLPAGGAVILRHYGAPGRQDLARELAALCRRRRIRLLIGGDARLAYAVGADGLHLPEWQVRRGPGRWRRWRPPGWIVTAAAHSPASLFRAAGAGADAALLSPVFATASHPGAGTLGALKFTAWCQLSPLPVYALGGISAANIDRLKDCGSIGFAGIGGFSESLL